MKKLLSLGILCASLVAAPLAAHADVAGPGNIGFTIFAPSFSPNSSLDPITGITAITNGSPVQGVPGTGSFDQVPSLTPLTISNLYPNGADGGNGTPFTITWTGFGTFTATAKPEVVSNATTGGGTGSSVELYILGTFVGTGVYADTVFESASVDLQYGRAGGSITGQGLLSTPAAPDPTKATPEPSSLALLGTGILGGVGMLRRRFKA